MQAQSKLTINARFFETAAQAIQHVNATGRGIAILFDQPMVVAHEDADRMEATGVQFAYLCEREMPDGTWQIVTVPVNE